MHIESAFFARKPRRAHAGKILPFPFRTDSSPLDVCVTRKKLIADRRRGQVAPLYRTVSCALAWCCTLPEVPVMVRV